MYYNKRKMAVSIFWVVAGAVLFALGCMDKIDPAWSGCGGGLLGVGLVQIVRNLKYNNNEEYKEKIDIEASDERNRYLRLKAWSWAGYIYVLGSAVLSLVCLAMGLEDLSRMLGLSMCAVLALFWGSYMVLRNKY